MKTSTKIASVLLLLPIVLVSYFLWLRSTVEIQVNNGVGSETVFLQPQQLTSNEDNPAQNLTNNASVAVDPIAETRLNSEVSKVSVARDIELNPELLDWYQSQPPGELYSLLFKGDEAKAKLYSNKAAEDINSFIELVARYGEGDAYLVWALSETISHRDKELLLSYLDESKVVAEVAYWKGLHRTHKQEFSDAFDYWKTKEIESMPEGVMLAALEYEQKGSFAFARQYVVASEQKLQTFELLDIYNQPDLDLLAQSVWDASQSNFGDISSLDSAIISARYSGNKGALFEIATMTSRIPEMLDNEYIVMKLNEFIKVDDLTNLNDHIHELIYFPKEKKWKPAK